jgi:hypothetical protein
VLRLAAAPKQSIKSGVVVVTGTANEAGTDKATGTVSVSRGGNSSAAKTYKLASLSVGHAANVTVKLKLKIPKKTRASLRRALAAGKRVTAHIKVQSKDASGNVAAKTKTVKLIR